MSHLRQYRYTVATAAEILHLSRITAAALVWLRDHDELLLLKFNFWSKMRLFFVFTLSQIAVFSTQPVKNKGGFLQKLNLHHFSLFRPVYGYQQVTSRVTLCSICAAEVSRGVHCERVNRLCCCFRGRGLRHINPLLSVWADQVKRLQNNMIVKVSDW